MTTKPHISTDELRDAYTRAGIFYKVGLSFERAIGIRMIRTCLENSALGARRRRAGDCQLRLVG